MYSVHKTRTLPIFRQFAKNVNKTNSERMERRIFRFLRWNRRRENDEEEAEEEEDSDANNDEAGKCSYCCRRLSDNVTCSVCYGPGRISGTITTCYFRMRVFEVSRVRVVHPQICISTLYLCPLV